MRYKILGAAALILSALFANAQVNLVVNSGYINVPPASYLVSGSPAANAVVLPTASAGILNTGYVVLAGGVSNTGGTFTSTAGTIILNGTTPQTISGNDYTTNTINGLVLTNPAGISLTGPTYITDSLSLQQGNFNMNNVSLTMRSSAAITARVAPVYGTVSNGNNVTVERYIAGHRAWRLVSVPLTATETINQAYQEGVYNTAISPWPAVNNNPFPGFGLHISGTQSPTGLGFDDTDLDNPSMMTYGGGNPTLGTDTWIGIPNTLSTSISYRDAYLLFVRGSRATQLPLNTTAPADNTIIRPTGNLKIGDQSYTCPANSFTLIGNPYASTIDFHSITRTNVIDAFSVFDPHLAGANGVGAFVTYTWNGASYSFAPPPASAGLGQNIQSSQAFLVQNTTGSVGNVTISETHKRSGSVSTVFAPMVNPSSFRTNLYNLKTGDPILVDGTLAIFGNYNAGLDEVDALKPINIRENMGHRTTGRSLAIDARPMVVQRDTLFYNIDLYTQPYRFEFISDGLDQTGLNAYLYDNYLHTYTPVSLSDTTSVDFTVNSDVASGNNNRFIVVFTTDAPLPVTVNNIRAYEKNSGIQVDWTLNQEMNMDKYEVEKSLTGNNFSKTGTVASSGNHSSGITYGWFDTDPRVGANFYRVKMYDKNGASAYTQVAKVVISNGPPSVTVYPNPITGNIISLQLNNIAKGTYTVTLTNKLGQLVYVDKIVHEGGSASRTIQSGKKLAAGSYQLQIGDYSVQVLVQ